MIVIGIDPGFSGAIAILDTATGFVDLHDMPVIPNKKGKTELNHSALFDILSSPGVAPTRVVVEQVASMPGQGVSSVFRFGQGYGAIQMAVAAHKYPVQYVVPQTWKKFFGLSRDKGVSRGLASQLYPNYAHLFARIKDDGRAEALLLAAYGSKNFTI